MKREGMTSREIVVCAACAVMMSFAGGVVFADDHEDAATVPAGVGFSGWLASPSGEPYKGEADLVVGVFANAEGGEPIEEFTFTDVDVDEGRFSITLESQNAALWDGSTRWFEVTVEGEVLSPRTAIVSTPYALRAGIATHLTDTAKADLLAEADMQLTATKTQLADAETKLTSAEARILALEERLAGIDTKLASMRVEGTDVFFEGVNVHIRDGSGATYVMGAPLPDSAEDVVTPADGSGLGNLIIGYNEDISNDDPDLRSGQHNLVVGSGHSYTSVAGIVAGYNNKTESHATATIGGWRNKATNRAAVIISGKDNRAEEEGAVVVGGEDNLSESNHTVVVGGRDNKANDDNSVVVGGRYNLSEAEHAVVVGGRSNVIKEVDDLANADGSVIIGGRDNRVGEVSNTQANNAVIVGGNANKTCTVSSAGADNAVIVGGTTNETCGQLLSNSDNAVIVGGVSNDTRARNTVVMGGENNTATGVGAVQIAGNSRDNPQINSGQVSP